MVRSDTKDLTRQRLEEKLRRECGATFMKALTDPNVTEIMLNPDGKLWLDIAGEGMRFTGEYLSATAAESMLSTCASMLRASLTYDNPILEGEFPLDGSRLEAMLPPVVDAPTFAIRKRAGRIFSLEDYAARGILRPLATIPPHLRHHKGNAFAAGFRHPIEALHAAITSKKNIVIVGGTGSGKTTLVNAVLHALATLCPQERIVALEDTLELQIGVENCVLLHATDSVSMPRLLRATMRLRPDRIIIGEVRGAEAYTLLKSWNSGHPGGVATLHANSAHEGLDKLAQYVFESPDARNFSAQAIGRMIATTVDLVLYIESIDEAPGRLITEILEVTGYAEDQYQFQSIKEV